MADRYGREGVVGGLVALIILDGWGLNPRRDHNAVALARTPTMDGLLARYPHTTLVTCGRRVGLPEGLMGNSEVGHLNLGAGRVVTQAMTRIDGWVEDGSLFENPALAGAMDRVKGTGRALHLMGLVSDGGVHSWPSHYRGLLRMAKGRGLGPRQVFVHAILDGRDTPPKSGAGHVGALAGFMEEIGFGGIATIVGRYYAMDRDKRWDRTRIAYDCYTLGAGTRAADPVTAVRDAYGRGETDEFVKPVVIAGEDGGPLATVADGDSLLFFNFRGDRPRQITRAFTLEGFDGFERERWPRVHYTCLTQYEKGLPVEVAYPPKALEQDMKNVVGRVLSDRGLRQLRVAETEKYAHVTFFFNGQEETPFPGEERILVPSPRVATYDLQPEMSAAEIAEGLIEQARARAFDAVICNFANPDMVGHTGKLDAAIRAVEMVDRCLGEVLGVIREVDGAAIVTADHGNAEQMLHYDTGEPHTAHTTNPVPFVVVDGAFRGGLREGGSLEDVGPTLLGMLGVERPGEMTGRDLRIA
ncbi:MAG: phosphoglycerate mutase (2,3-diphosphoglycerate-independent) [Candidatus Handelsmanbacteria bacterium RIFCSPLOWO2_12_FULL_64_10]|uniref:2,3-bisphosphoglycerate-independent phosphoglycerate mutase n=1 Tax=Handelsmanbacteria sp. (strain RIFCSPLOWO2_12_FULL_64_10) TaxID=1817868 RepID=A0A1F6D204_HANXR|nr:MAG: phosphoglycerate mutase (2,3-diphosphoglycerate-independent) [Candidatus Handelsmanbacteria bacterium RIFCSPLOWO2_12_FULL_64_10]